MTPFRAYFWFLVTAVVVGGADGVNEYLLETRAVDPRWMAVAGFAGLLIAFFIAFRRSAG